MEIISNPTQVEIMKAAKALKDGHLVAFPTETVYGLGADATNHNAVSRIYSVKSRPTNHPIIVHVSTIKKLDIWAVNIPDYAWQLAEKFWPGPMTLILKRSGVAKDFITGGQDNVGLRVPSQSLALAILAEFESIGGLGVAAPSANRFGAVSPTSASAVEEEIGKYLISSDLILDQGICSIGIESTIVECVGEIPVILRPGAITAEMIEDKIGIKINKELTRTSVKSSGQMKKHYSPKAQIEISDDPKPGYGFIGLASIYSQPNVIRLASPINLVEYSNLLYSALRLADNLLLKKIIVSIPEGDGLAWAIRDRVEKAAGHKNS
jgi:L-threonylcarbamoyladenylate synthase